MICQESIGRLIDIYKDDDKILKTIERCVTSFEEYHSRIFEMELWMKIYSKTVSEKNIRKMFRCEIKRVLCRTILFWEMLIY